MAGVVGVARGCQRENGASWTPTDVAALLSYLVSRLGRASASVSGQYLCPVIQAKVASGAGARSQMSASVRVVGRQFGRQK